MRKIGSFSYIIMILLCCLLQCTFAAAEDSASGRKLFEEMFIPGGTQITINETSFHFPMSMEAFKQLGWSATEDTQETVPARSYLPTASFQIGNLEAYILLLNSSPNPASQSECSVCGLFLDQTQTEDAPEVSVTLPGNLTIGHSTQEDILAAYGSPDQDSTEDDLHQLTYQYDEYQRLDLFLDSQTGLLTEIDLQNMPEYPDFPEEKMNRVPDQTSRTAFSYQAPKEMGTSLSSYIVDFQDHLYALPTPVSEYLKNGWNLDEDRSDSVIPGEGFGWVCLTSESHSFFAVVCNYSSTAAEVRDCLVTSAESNDDDFPFSLKIALPISVGMSQEDLLASLNNQTYTTETGDSVVYTIEDPDNSMNYYRFTVDPDKKLLTGMEVSHIPKRKR